MKTKLRLFYITTCLLLFSLFPFAIDSWGLVKAAFVYINLLTSLVIISHIVFSRVIDFFSPLIFLLLNVLMGITLRSLYMVQNADKWLVKNRLLINQDFPFFIIPSIVVLVSIIFFITGYTLYQRPIRLSNIGWLQKDNWHPRKVKIVISILTVIGFVFSYLFFVKTGFEGLTEGLSISNISKKRFVEIEGKKAAFGYYRWLASFIQFAFYFYLAFFAKQNWKFLSFKGLFLVFLTLSALMFPLMVNSRAGIMLNFIIGLMIWHYVRKLNVKVIMMPILFGIGIILFLSVSRKNQTSDIDELKQNLTIDLLLEAFVGGRHYLGISKTAHIMEAVPDQMSYEYGKTFTGWIFAPIPRSLWHGKPVIVHGPVIVEKALHGDYGKNGGVPPGFLGELFWNFGYFGMFGGMFLLGLLLKKIYVSFLPYLNNNLNFLLLYIQVCLAFSFFLPATALNDGMIHFLKDGILTLAILFLIKLRYK